MTVPHGQSIQGVIWVWIGLACIPATLVALVVTAVVATTLAVGGH